MYCGLYQIADTACDNVLILSFESKVKQSQNEDLKRDLSWFPSLLAEFSPLSSQNLIQSPSATPVFIRLISVYANRFV